MFRRNPTFPVLNQKKPFLGVILKTALCDLMNNVLNNTLNGRCWSSHFFRLLPVASSFNKDQTSTQRNRGPERNGTVDNFLLNWLDPGEVANISRRMDGLHSLQAIFHIFSFSWVFDGHCMAYSLPNTRRAAIGFPVRNRPICLTITQIV